MIKPIIFNTEMVRAILAGTKTQTRRIVKGIEGLNVYRAEPSEDSYQSLAQWDFFYGWTDENGIYDAIESVKAPYTVGDVLWVRETWCKYWLPGEHVLYRYKASHPNGNKRPTSPEYDEPYEIRLWKPSIHMPKDAARIFLRVTNVRAERLQDCVKGWCLDVEKEGIKPHQDPILYLTDDDYHAALRDAMQKLWDSTIKGVDLPVYGWDANHWVWVIEFERCDRPEGWCEE